MQRGFDAKTAAAEQGPPACISRVCMLRVSVGWVRSRVFGGGGDGAFVQNRSQLHQVFWIHTKKYCLEV